MQFIVLALNQSSGETTAVTITVLRWKCCLSKIWLNAGTSEYLRLVLDFGFNSDNTEL